jgi:hypothetical protein
MRERIGIELIFYFQPKKKKQREAGKNPRRSRSHLMSYLEAVFFQMALFSFSSFLASNFF